ncbi:hypothetical protein ABZ621_14990 [Streptomyces sp. NPDC007863]|uniref:hypothetical protein n=1 Tax=Streptomyces sp. NPDC007863 TaxID=3154894 RepID=UPI0033E66091
MTAYEELRLLPWSGPDGKPCFLSTDEPDGHLSRVADNVEAIQLGMAAELLERATDVFADEDVALEQLRPVASDLTRALRDVLRVAVSRGQRLQIPDGVALDGDEDGPRLPAAAFG